MYGRRLLVDERSLAVRCEYSGKIVDTKVGVSAIECEYLTKLCFGRKIPLVLVWFISMRDPPFKNHEENIIQYKTCRLTVAQSFEIARCLVFAFLKLFQVLSPSTKCQEKAHHLSDFSSTHLIKVFLSS